MNVQDSIANVKHSFLTAQFQLVVLRLNRLHIYNKKPYSYSLNETASEKVTLAADFELKLWT